MNKTDHEAAREYAEKILARGWGIVQEFNLARAYLELEKRVKVLEIENAELKTKLERSISGGFYGKEGSHG